MGTHKMTKAERIERATALYHHALDKAHDYGRHARTSKYQGIYTNLINACYKEAERYQEIIDYIKGE